MRLFKAEHLLHIIYNSGIIYPVPPTLNYFWNFGSLALLCLGSQILTVFF